MLAGRVRPRKYAHMFSRDGHIIAERGHRADLDVRREVMDHRCRGSQSQGVIAWIESRISASGHSTNSLVFSVSLLGKSTLATRNSMVSRRIASASSRIVAAALLST